MTIEASATIGIVHKNYEIFLNSYKAFVMTSSWLHPIGCYEQRLCSG
jgi:hypothetical protein